VEAIMNPEKELRAWAQSETGNPNWREYCSFLVSNAEAVGTSGPDGLFMRLSVAGVSDGAKFYVMERLFGGE
jgi:hypothetical protein